MVLTTAMLIGMGLMGAGGLLKGGSQLIQGISDKKKGKTLEEQAGDRPEFNIPESVDQQIALYRQMAQGGMPGEDLMKQDIQASTARTAGQAAQLADSPVGALTALGGAQDRELSAMRDLQQRAAMYQSQMQGQYAQAVGNRANWESEQWRQNNLLPWEIDMNRAMGLQESGKGNIMGAMDSFGSTLGQMGGFLGTNAMYENMYPNYGNASANAGQGYAGPNPWGSQYTPPVPYQYTIPTETNPMTPKDTQAERDLYGNPIN